MADWFTADQRWALIRKYGRERPEEKAIEEACALSPEVCELWATKDEPIWSGRQDEFAQLLWPRVLRALGILEDTPAGAPPLAEPKLDERTERWRIPTSACWYILEQRVKNGEAVSVHRLSEQTRKVKFVGRRRVQRLTDWIDANPERARHALELHDIPPEFRATPRGVLVPRLRNRLR
jgi:hypothetical protein